VYVGEDLFEEWRVKVDEMRDRHPLLYLIFACAHLTFNLEVMTVQCYNGFDHVYILFFLNYLLPSNPGRDLPFLCLSFLFSFLLAILSALFCCLAAIFEASCSFLSAL
jgi:hypothetical protein